MLSGSISYSISDVVHRPKGLCREMYLCSKQQPWRCDIDKTSRLARATGQPPG